MNLDLILSICSCIGKPLLNGASRWAIDTFVLHCMLRSLLIQMEKCIYNHILHGSSRMPLSAATHSLLDRMFEYSPCEGGDSIKVPWVEPGYVPSRDQAKPVRDASPA